MKNILKDFTKQDYMCLLAILVGSSIAIVNPSDMDNIFNKTILAVILTKIFF